MSNVTEVIKEISLDLSNIPMKDRKQAKDEVRAYIENEVLRSVAKGVSPVEGEGRFRILTSEYAKNEKGGNMTANLELEGDLLNAFKSKNLAGSKIEIGVRGKEAPKADGHNQISGEAKAWAAKTHRTKYKRRFVPDEEQSYKKSIMAGVGSILSSFRQEKVNAPAARIDSVISTPDNEQVTVGGLFDDSYIGDLLAQAIKKRDGL